MRLGAGGAGGAAAPPGKKSGGAPRPLESFGQILLYTSTVAKLRITQNIEFRHQNITG